MIKWWVPWVFDAETILQKVRKNQKSVWRVDSQRFRTLVPGLFVRNHAVGRNQRRTKWLIINGWEPRDPSLWDLKCHPDSFSDGGKYTRWMQPCSRWENWSKKELRSSISEENQPDQEVIMWRSKKRLTAWFQWLKPFGKKVMSWFQWIPGSPRWRQAARSKLGGWYCQRYYGFSWSPKMAAVVAGAWSERSSHV